MSRYTTELRWPIEQALDDLNLAHTEENWPKVYGKIGLDDYPIFDEAHRSVLNDKIIRRYYTREIGFETVGLFRWNLRARMHEIMPYYNQLYESETLVTDPMLSLDRSYSEIWSRDEKIDESRDGSTTDTADATSESESKTRTVFQDTPMNGLDTGAIEGMDYATNVTFEDASTDSTSHRDAKGTSESSRAQTGDYDGTRTHSEKGFDTSQSELLLQYRRTLINIDSEIVDGLEDLFMGIW